MFKKSLKQLRKYTYRSFFKLVLVVALPLALIYFLPYLSSSTDTISTLANFIQSGLIGITNSLVYCVVFLIIRRSLSKSRNQAGFEYGVLLWILLYGVNFISFIIFPNSLSLGTAATRVLQQYFVPLVFMGLTGLFISYFFDKFDKR